MPARHPYQLGDEPVPGYRLVKFLGRGGFGEVWKASAPGGAAVALKMIVNLSGAEGRKELRALSIVKRIQHAHLVPVTAVWLKDGDGNILIDDFAEEEDRLLNQRSPGATNATSETMIVPPGHTDPRSAELIIAMGLGHKSLFDRLQECRQQQLDGIPPAELLDYMEQAARAIDYLNSASHELGKALVAVQHCDIKPHNILIVGTAVQVCDFGLARVRGDVRATASTGASVAYASPEVLEAEGRPSEATDQYSLAISYFELRTGTLPYRDSSFAKVMQAVLTGNLELAKLPPNEQAAIRRATARDPQQRFPTAMAMVKALRRAVEAPEVAPTPSRGWPKLVAAAMLLIAISSGAFWYARGRNVVTPDKPPDVVVPETDLNQLVADAGSALKRGDDALADEIFARVLSIDPRVPEALTGRGELRLKQGRVDEALADFELARQILPEKANNPAHAQALIARGIGLQQQKKYNEAIADFEAAEKLDAGSVDPVAMATSYLFRGEQRQAGGDLDQAVADFTTVIQKFPQQAREAYVHRAECRLQLADLEQAAADAEAAIQADQEQADGYAVRGMIRLAANDAAGATADFTTVAGLSPEYLGEPQRARLAATAFQTHGRQLLAANDVEAALPAFERAAQLEPAADAGFKTHADFAKAYVHRATALRKAGKLDEAIADCSRAIEDHPQFAAGAYCERGACLAAQNNLPQAVEDLTAAIQLDPDDDLAYSRRGEAHMKLQKYEQAIQDFDAAIRLNGDFIDRYNRGLTLSMVGRSAEAESVFTQLISEEASDPDVYYQRAHVEIDLKHYDRAIADLRTAQKLLTPAGQGAAEGARGVLADVQALLGWVLACQPGSTRATADEALRVAKEAGLFSDWNEPWHLDAMAAAYASSAVNFSKPDDFREAVVWQKRAIGKATANESTPPLAPSRDKLLKLYESNEAFRLPGEDGQPAAGAAARPSTDKPAAEPTSNNPTAASPMPVKPPTPSPTQLDDEIRRRLQKLPAKVRRK